MKKIFQTFAPLYWPVNVIFVQIDNQPKDRKSTLCTALTCDLHNNWCDAISQQQVRCNLVIGSKGHLKYHFISVRRMVFLTNFQWRSIRHYLVINFKHNFVIECDFTFTLDFKYVTYQINLKKYQLNTRLTVIFSNSKYNAFISNTISNEKAMI